MLEVIEKKGEEQSCQLALPFLGGMIEGTTLKGQAGVGSKKQGNRGCNGQKIRPTGDRVLQTDVL